MRIPTCTPAASAAAVIGPTSASLPGSGASAAGTSASLGRERSAARSANPGMRRQAITELSVLHEHMFVCQDGRNGREGAMEVQGSGLRRDGDDRARGDEHVPARRARPHLLPARRDRGRSVRAAERHRIRRRSRRLTGETRRTIGFLVADLDAAIEELHAAGVETDGIGRNARWRYTHFRMPDGKLYELVEELPLAGD